jgi:hypothetical protein
MGAKFHPNQTLGDASRGVVEAPDDTRYSSGYGDPIRRSDRFSIALLAIALPVSDGGRRYFAL